MPWRYNALTRPVGEYRKARICLSQNFSNRVGFPLLSSHFGSEHAKLTRERKSFGRSSCHVSEAPRRLNTARFRRPQGRVASLALRERHTVYWPASRDSEVKCDGWLRYGQSFRACNFPSRGLCALDSPSGQII